MGLFDHITRAPSGLPAVVHDKRKLFHKSSQKVGNAYKDVYEPFGTEGFIIDLPNLQTGWAGFQKGVAGRTLYMVNALSGETPAKPDTEGVTFAALALVKVASATLLGELEIADTAIAKGIEKLMIDYAEAPQSDKGMIPEIKFHTANATFDITGWHERDIDFWGEID